MGFLSLITYRGLTNWFTQPQDGEALSWSDRIKGWIVDWISKGIIAFIEAIEPEGLEFVDEGLAQLADAPGVPDVIKNLIARIRAGGKPIPLLLLIPIAVLMIFPMITSLFQPLGRIINYGQERIFHSGRYDWQTAIRLWLRDPEAYAWAMSDLEDAGLNDTRVQGLQELIKIRLDPTIVMTAWRRDPEAFSQYLKDLSDQGWSDDRIEALKEATKAYPGVQDVTTWLAREVFEPAMVEKYGLKDELPVYEETLYPRIGIDAEQATNYWIAHWVHASWMQVVEMLHRGLITEADVYEWFRLVEIPPFWRQLLIDQAYTWPTRVDVRRWWDMRTIDEARLRELYSGMGYRGDNLDDYVTWTKVYVAFPDLLARWSKGWISLLEVRDELVRLGMPAARVEEFIQAKVKAEEPARTAAERDLTKTDIIKGVKQERISRGQGVDLLMDLGYDLDEADYILAINIPVDQVESVVKDRQLTKSDIIAGLRTEVLTEDEARTRLLGLRYTAVDAELLLDIFQASIKPPAEPRQREASKADIVLAVKKDLITPEEGYLMLLDLGFTPEASEFILLVRAESSPFSPVTFDEFKDLTGKWRKAAGMTTPAFNDKLREAGAELVKISDQVKALEIAVRTEEMLLIDADVIPEENEKRLKDLQVALNRAIAEKERLQGEYNALVAEFRQMEE